MTTPPSHDDDAPLAPADRLAMGEAPPSVRVAAPRPVTGTPSSARTAGDSPGPEPAAGTSSTGAGPSSTDPGTSPAPWPGTTTASGTPGTPGTPSTPSTPSAPSTPSTPGTTGPAGRTDPRPSDDAGHAPDDATADQDELPEPPAKPGVGRHLLGVLLGLLITPIGLLLSAIGTARLAEVAGTADMGTDTLGVVMLGVGLALLAAVVLLGTWTPALPLTGGLVWGVGLGTAYLVIPGMVEDAVESLFDGTPEAAAELGEAAMSGHLLAVGVLLTVAGVAIGLARRRGRRWAEGVAAAEVARIRSVHARRDQIRLAADRRARQAREAR